MKILQSGKCSWSPDGKFWMYAALHAPNGNPPSTVSIAYDHYTQAWGQLRRQLWAYGGNRQINRVRPRPDARPFTVAPNVVPVGLVVITPKPVQRVYTLTESGRAFASSEAQV